MQSTVVLVFIILFFNTMVKEMVMQGGTKKTKREIDKE